MENPNIENLEEALAYIQALRKEYTDLKEKVQKQEQFISNLTEMLVNDRKKMFGRSSEQMKYIEGAEQLSLFNEAEKESAAGASEPDEKTLVAAHERSKKHTKEEIFKGLEHFKQFCEITPAVCPNCGEPLTEIGIEFVRSELNIMWVFCSGKHSEHKMSLYYHHATRSGKVALDILGNYSGYLQTDGYNRIYTEIY